MELLCRNRRVIGTVKRVRIGRRGQDHRREAKVASEPEALIAWFGSLGLAMTRIGLEAGPLSQWLFAGGMEASRVCQVELIGDPGTCAMRLQDDAGGKTDRKDARGIAELMRMGWFRPVHCKSISAQETRAILRAARPLPGVSMGRELLA